MNHPIWRADVIVMPKEGVSDPQGEAVKGGLHMLGHDAVYRVRVGRHIEVDVAAETEAAAYQNVVQMAERLLANPVIEQFQISNIRGLVTEGIA